MKNTIYAMLAVLVVSVGLMAGCGSREPAEEPAEEPSKEPSKEVEPAVARKAPGFTLSSFDGKTISLSDYRGKIVVLEWFNYECPFVLRHYGLPNTMVELAKKYKDKNVVWLAINSTNRTPPELNIEFAEKRKLPYPILDDRSGTVGRAYGAKTTPHMYIIDEKGSIAYQGAIDNDPRGRKKQGLINYVEKALVELTNGKEVSTTDTMSYGSTVKYAK
ncbi:MAG TPA: redoxin domain-containing protein [Sedimentisphaerales bacterium]|nr:redoxin domain-containing protein [Sedimentisphaerales bacterium]